MIVLEGHEQIEGEITVQVHQARCAELDTKPAGYKVVERIHWAERTGAIVRPQALQIPYRAVVRNVLAISVPGLRWRRRLSMHSITSGGVGLRSR